MRGWIPEVIKRIQEKELIHEENSKPSTLRVCMELRRLMKERGLSACPYFSEAETIDYFTDPDRRRIIDLKKRQNMEHFL